MRTVKNSRKDQLKHRFSILSPDKIPTGKIGKDTLLKDICERSIQKDENKTNHRTTSYKKSKEILGKNKLLVTVIFFCEQKQRTKRPISFAPTEQNPKTIILHSGTNGLKSDGYPEEIARESINLAASCKT